MDEDSAMTPVSTQGSGVPGQGSPSANYLLNPTAPVAFNPEVLDASTMAPDKPDPFEAPTPCSPTEAVDENDPLIPQSFSPLHP